MLSRVAVAIALVADAIMGWFIVTGLGREHTASHDAAAAWAVAIMVAALAAAVVLRPTQKVLQAARGFLTFAFVFVLLPGTVIVLWSPKDPVMAWSVFIGLLAVQLLAWIAAWKAEPITLRQAIATSFVGSLQVLGVGLLGVFIVSLVARMIF